MIAAPDYELNDIVRQLYDREELFQIKPRIVKAREDEPLLADAISEISDEQLKACVEYNTRGLTYLSDVRAIACFGPPFWLDAYDPNQKPIESLSGLEQFTSLTELYIRGGEVSEFSPVSALHELTSLTLRGLGVTDLQFLQPLAKLKTLDLGFNAVTDVTPLAGLRSLNVLSLAFTSVSDIDSLSSLRRINRLSLWRTPVDDLTPLANMPNLTDLTLVDCEAVSDLSPLRGLKNLRSISVENTAVTDISPLEDSDGLQSFRARNSSVKDLTPLSQMYDLRILEVSSPVLSPVPSSVFEGKIMLERVEINFAGITDLTPFSQMDRLKVLSLHGNTIADVTPVVGLDLDELKLRDSGITDLSPFSLRADMRDLEHGPGYSHLDLSGNKIQDVTPLASLRWIHRLTLNRNPISDVTPLADLGLGSINISDTSVSCDNWDTFRASRDDGGEGLSYFSCL